MICRIIFLIRFLKVDTVVCWDPWAHDEENPDHYTLARAVEAACWMAGRVHDYPEQVAAGLVPKTVQDKYYFALRPEITRVVDISKQIDKKVEANRANVAKGPAGHLGSRLRAELAQRNRRLPLLGEHQTGRQRAFLKIQDGCDAHCTYCIIPQLRPTLWSKPVADVVDEAKRLIDAGLALPAYEMVMKCSHTFNLLDARGAISVTERAAYILRVRALASACCEAWLAGSRVIV